MCAVACALPLDGCCGFAAGEHHLRLLRMRESADLEGIEVGPELGRGSYGRVYKGAGPPNPCPMPLLST